MGEDADHFVRDYGSFQKLQENDKSFGSAMGCSCALVVYGEYFPNVFFHCVQRCVRRIVDTGRNKNTDVVIEGGSGGSNCVL